MQFGGEDPSKQLTTVCVTNATSSISQNASNNFTNGFDEKFGD